MEPNAFANLNGPNAGLTGAVQSSIPLASTWHGAASTERAGFTQPALNTQAPTPTGFLAKLESFGTESAHLVAGAVDWLGNGIYKGVSAPIHLAESTGHGLVDNYESKMNTQASNQLSATVQKLNTQYKDGLISEAAYKASLDSITESLDQLDKQQQANRAKINQDQAGAYMATADLATDVLTIATLGTGEAAVGATAGTTAAADFLFSHAPDAAFAAVEKAIANYSVDGTFASTLAHTTSTAIKDSIYTALFAGAKDASISQMSQAGAVSLMLKFPLTFNMMSGGAEQTYTDLAKGDFSNAVKTAAWNALLLGSGGMIGYGAKMAGTGLKIARESVFGRAGYLEQFASSLGKDANKMRAVLDSNPELAKNFAAMAQTNINGMKGDITAAVARHINHFWSTATPFKEMSEEQILQDGVKYAEHARAFQKQLVDHFVASGMSSANAAKEADKYALGRWTVFDKAQIAKGLSSLDTTDSKQLLAEWNKMKLAAPNASWANNPSLDNQIRDVLSNVKSPDELRKAILKIEAQTGVKGSPVLEDRLIRNQLKQAAKDGYVLITPKVNEAPFREGNIDDVYATQVAPKAGLSYLGAALTAAGMSPDQASVRIGQLMSNEFSDILSAAEITVPGSKNAQVVLGKLSSYANSLTLPVTDLRQFGLRDIEKALKVDTTTAMQVRNALSDAYIRIPLSVKGAGDALYGRTLRYVPGARMYTRVQGGLRYSWNPFFKARLAYKTEFLSQMEAGGKFPTLLGTNTILRSVAPQYYSRIDGVASLMEKSNFFAGGFTGELASDTETAGSQYIKGRLLTTQKRSIATLVMAQADRVGMTPREFIDSSPNAVKDTVDTILHYDPHSTILNSPMMRTLNMAFFPMRFNTKITIQMTKFLQKQPLGIQMATTMGMYRAHAFLNSTEGQQWYSQNSDIIKLFAYFSPLETVSSVSQFLTGLSEADWKTTVGAMGSLGGLPFGWIPGLLASEGLIDYQPSYVNPTTGKVANNYIPVNVRGRMSAALQDLIGNLFSYPGSELGLPSKTKVDVSVSNLLTGGKSTDFRQVPQTASPQQQQFQQAVQALHPAQTNQQQPSSGPAPTQDFQPNTKLMTSPLTSPTVTTKTAKKKKADYTPWLLPGQSSLGAL